MPGMEPTAIIIDGRRFSGVSQELSAAQDHYLIGQLRLSGALEILNAPGSNGLKQEPEKVSESLLTQILISGRTSQVLAGVLTEEGKQWTVAEAERNAVLFAAVTDPAEKETMMSAVMWFVIGFFQYATASVATSRKSSLQN